MTARIALREQRARGAPFVTVSLPRFDALEDTVELTLKNLGGGPAAMIAVGLYHGEEIISAKLAPGLAPNESEVWQLLAVGWYEVSFPSPFEIEVRGNCQDGVGKWHPLHYLGSPLMPTQEALQTSGPTKPIVAATTSVDPESGVWEAQALVQLKIAARATYEQNQVRALRAWGELWARFPRSGLELTAFQAWAGSEWERLGCPADAFVPPSDVRLDRFPSG